MSGLDTWLNDAIRKPKQIDDKVYVYNGHGKLVKVYSAIELGKKFFTMSNDAFYDMYGFNWVPRGRYWDIAKKAVGKM